MEARRLLATHSTATKEFACQRASACKKGNEGTQAAVASFPSEFPSLDCGRGQLFSSNLASIVIESIESFHRSTGLQLNAAQQRAVEVAVHSPLSVLTGWAGTGKTTVLEVIHGVAEQISVPILQMALSGRAAQRMRETTGREASTIAAFLRAAQRRHRSGK